MYFEYMLLKGTTVSCLLIPLQTLCSEGSQTGCPEDTQAAYGDAHMLENEGLLPHAQDWAILEVCTPGLLMSSDDCVHY